MTRLQKIVARVLAILKGETSEPAAQAVALLNEGLRDAREEKSKRVAEFLESETVEAPGESTVVSVLRVRFLYWLPREERAAWTRKKFCAQLRKHKALREGTANRLECLDTLLRVAQPIRKLDRNGESRCRLIARYRKRKCAPAVGEQFISPALEQILASMKPPE